MMAPTPVMTPVEAARPIGNMAEGARTPSAAGQALALPSNNQMGTISLGTLIQYINQRTYSDLLNLAEM